MLETRDSGNVDNENEQINIPIPFLVDVARDNMSASIRFEATKGNIAPTVDDIDKALKERGVVHGVDYDAVGRGLARLQPFVVAKGTMPIAGTDAKIERKFDVGQKGRPATKSYDKVDFKDMNLFIRATAGDLLAVRIPHTAGEAGTNVLGEPVPAKPGKPIPMPQGKNTKVINDNELVATIDGQVVESSGKINVDPHLVINSSIDVGTGNIDFAGSIEIKGDVESGFSVRADGDIDITGMIGGADVRGRNVYVRGGIRGMNIGKIIADEDVRIAFIESANVEAGRDIHVHDVVLHSSLIAGHHIYVNEKRGMITGGKVEAGELIEAKIIGNHYYVASKIEVGINPNIQKKYDMAQRDLKQAEERINQVNLSLEHLKKQNINTLSELRREQMTGLIKAQLQLAGQIKRLKDDIAKWQSELENMKRGTVSVSDIIYPGTRITINGINKNVEEDLRRVKLYVNDDNIVVGVL